jgi:hypothetical protein
LILQSYLVFYRVVCAVATPLSNRLAALPALILILLVIRNARRVNIAVDSVVNIVRLDCRTYVRL